MIDVKKLTGLCLALLLALSLIPALADPTPGIASWTIAEMSNDVTGDFDNDGTMESFHFVTSVDEYGDGDFMLAVGSAAVMQEDCVGLLDTVYFMRIGWTGSTSDGDDGFYATLFMVAEYGPSDDPYTYCYLYIDGKLLDVGAIPAMPYNMTVDPMTGTITAQVRAAMIGTWSRPADFILATGYSWDDEGFYSYYRITEMPRPIYPFGMIVSLKEELPLLASQTDRVYAATLFPEKDSQVILVASDDVRWLYVSSMDGLTAGWVKMSDVDYVDMITVGDTEMDVDDVFGDILYAD